MVRTSLVLPDTLHQRLLIFARQENIPISRFILDILDKALAAQEQARIKKMYQALDKLDGLGLAGVTDASATINQTLYGDHGAWQPQTR
jgi:hypothetical protein